MGIVSSPSPRPKAWLAAALLAALLAACKSDVEKAQSRWTRLDVWEGQRIEETTYRITRKAEVLGRAVLRIYRGREDLSRFDEKLGKRGEATDVFRVNLSQERQSTAGLGEEVQRLDSLWFGADDLRLRYATQSALVWNGNIFKEIIVSGKKARVFIHSHLTGAREVEAPFPDGAVPDIALGFFVRAVLSAVDDLDKVPVLTVGSIWLSATPAVATTKFSLVGEEELEIEGKDLPTRKIEVSNEFGARRYWIAQEAPNLLVQWEGEGDILFTTSGHARLNWPE